VNKLSFSRDCFASTTVGCSHLLPCWLLCISSWESQSQQCIERKYLNRLALQDFTKFLFMRYLFLFSAMEICTTSCCNVRAVSMPVQASTAAVFLKQAIFVHPSLVITAVNPVRLGASLNTKPKKMKAFVKCAATAGCFACMCRQTNPKYTIIRTCTSNFFPFHGMQFFLVSVS
jgi:hypothetical protein